MSMSNRTVLTQLIRSLWPLWHTPQYKGPNPNITKKKGVKEEESVATWFRHNLIYQKMDPDKWSTKTSDEEKQQCLTPGTVPWSMADKFFYFAYGSNMLEKRILINNPSARKCGFGKLKDFRLDFITQSKRWRGASATIVPLEGSEVWGVIWSLENTDMPNLDKQEGVDEKIYFPLTVEVEGWGCEATKCRVYQQCRNPEEFCDLSDLPEERRPSQLYLDTIIKGAVENELPSHYVEFLKTIKDNGYVGHGLPRN